MGRVEKVGGRDLYVQSIKIHRPIILKCRSMSANELGRILGPEEILLDICRVGCRGGGLPGVVVSAGVASSRSRSPERDLPTSPLHLLLFTSHPTSTDTTDNQNRGKSNENPDAENIGPTVLSTGLGTFLEPRRRESESAPGSATCWPRTRLPHLPHLGS